MKRQVVVIILIFTFGCNPNTREKDSSGSLDTAKVESASNKITDKGLFHPPHEEDKDYPWYDTRNAGHWIKESYLDSLKDIFKNDTTRSLYEYTLTLDPCSKELLFIEIEGCAKENIFYFKNSGCDDQYLAKSTFEVGKETTFTLKDVHSGKNYFFQSPEYNELIINNDRFVQNDYELSEIEGTLDGRYVVYDEANRFLDTVDYSGGNFTNAGTFSRMNLHYLTYANGRTNGEHPTLPHSDLVTVWFYTGDSLRTELVDDSGEGRGIFETTPETISERFDIKRSLQGFELHNVYDFERRVSKEGLVYRFRRIVEFENRRRKR